MKKQSHTFVMTTQVMSSAFHEEENNMEKITNPKDTVWKCNKTHKYAKGEKSPFSSAVLVAKVGDPVPNVEFEKPKKKAVKKVENKAVKPSEDK